MLLTTAAAGLCSGAQSFNTEVDIGRPQFPFLLRRLVCCSENLINSEQAFGFQMQRSTEPQVF